MQSNLENNSTHHNETILKPWLKSYDQNVPATIQTNEYQTLDQLIDATFIKFANREAFSCHGVVINYHEAMVIVRKIAYSLDQFQVKKGDRVAIMLPNCLQYPLIIFAIIKLGAAVVNINPLYTANEVQKIVSDAEPKVVFVLEQFAHHLDNIYDKFGIRQVITTKLTDLYPFIKRKIIDFVICYIKKNRAQHSFKAKAQSFHELISNAAEKNSYPKINQEDVAFLQYTGGTSGTPKGVILLHKNIIANLMQINLWIQDIIKDYPHHIVINALPLYHIFSLSANLLTFFTNGGHNVMIVNPKDMKDLIRNLKSSKFTIFNGLNTLYNALLHNDEFLTAHFPYFKYSISGGMAIRPSVAALWEKTTKVTIRNCYGMTETSPAISMNKMHGDFSESVGFPISSTDIKICNVSDKSVLPIGEIGNIFVRGPQVMHGYWKREDLTRSAIQDGWLNTEDLGYIDQKGMLYITGRTKEIIIVSGFNVYPSEVEDVISKIEGVREVAVVGISNDSYGEEVYAFIIPDENIALSGDSIINHCRNMLTKYKVPRKVIFAKNLPKSAIGKIVKKDLIKEYQNGSLSII